MCADTRKNDIYSFLSKRGQQIVKKTHPVGRLNLDQGVGRMGLVIDCDPGREFQLLQPSMLNLLPRLLEQRRKLKSFHFERVTQRVFNQGAIAHLGHGAPFHIAHPKNSEKGLVVARENVSA